MDRFKPTDEQRQRYHQKLDEALDEGAPTRGRFTDYELGYTVGEGENRHAETHPLHSTTFDVDFDAEPLWPPVARVESLPIKKRRRIARTALKRCVVISDTHSPFEDDKAIDVALQLISDIKPDKVIHAGDALDMTAWSSKFITTPEYAESTQQALIDTHQLFRSIREAAPSAEVAMIEGNHSNRLNDYLLRNARAAYQLRRPDRLMEWPIMSVPNMLALDSLGVEWVGGYPANRYFINERLQVKHGNVAKAAGKTALAIVMDDRISTISGHIHRIESTMRTVNTYEGMRTYAAWSIGCLCLLDGTTPGTRTGTDERERNVPNYGNQQHGFAVVEYEDGDKPFNVEQVFIDTANNYRARYQGRTYSA